MRLKVLSPSHILIDQEVKKVIAQGKNGFFCLEPRHVDFVSALSPGILQFTDDNNEEVFIAVDEGILVKCGTEVTVSAYNAVRGESLESLEETVELRFRQLDDAERSARSALAKLEAGVIRRFTQMQEQR